MPAPQNSLLGNINKSSTSRVETHSCQLISSVCSVITCSKCCICRKHTNVSCMNAIITCPVASLLYSSSLDCKTLRGSLVIFWLLFIRHFSCLDGFFFPVSVCLFPEGYPELLRVWPEWGILEISTIMDNYGGSVLVNMKVFLNDSLRIQKRLGANQMKVQHVSPVKKQEWVTLPKQHQTGSANLFHQFCAGFRRKICRFLCNSIWTVSKLGRG